MHRTVVVVVIVLAAGLVTAVGQSNSGLLYTLLESTDTICSVAFSLDGTLVAATSWDGTLRLWNTATGSIRRTVPSSWPSPVALAFSPDGRTIASSGGGTSIELRDLATGALLTSFGGGYSLAFSPDGRTIAAGEWPKVKLWDVATQRCLLTLTGHTSRVWSVAFSPDGRILASADGEGTVILWNATTGRLLHTLIVAWVHPTVRAWSPVYSIAFSPDGRTLACGGDSITLWDPVSGKRLREMDIPAGAVYSVAFYSVAFSPDGRTLAAGTNSQTVTLWDVATGTPLRTLSGHSGAVNSVAFSPDGNTVASGAADHTVRLWVVGGNTSSPVPSAVGSPVTTPPVAPPPVATPPVATPPATTLKASDVSVGFRYEWSLLYEDYMTVSGTVTVTNLGSVKAEDCDCHVYLVSDGYIIDEDRKWAYDIGPGYYDWWSYSLAGDVNLSNSYIYVELKCANLEREIVEREKL
ncbi:MAG: WD40 repeat domain-containing protein [Candidatus Bipolaricaulota bacterium]|nr:WD40 repeat domain-containing protein [Candidatus Bipolaricaulota bacterium]